MKQLSPMECALFCLAFLMIAVLSFNAFIAQQREDKPTWCDYPAPSSVQNLRDVVNEHATTIAKYSPGQPIDTYTIQLDLMSECAR